MLDDAMVVDPSLCGGKDSPAGRNFYSGLLFDHLRRQDRASMTRMLSVELKRQPGNENVSLKALEKRIKRWLAH